MANKERGLTPPSFFCCHSREDGNPGIPGYRRNTGCQRVPYEIFIILSKSAVISLLSGIATLASLATAKPWTLDQVEHKLRAGGNPGIRIFFHVFFTVILSAEKDPVHLSHQTSAFIPTSNTSRTRGVAQFIARGYPMRMRANGSLLLRKYLGSC
jgi:hypothetical protein